jgi:hypothetical protein
MYRVLCVLLHFVMFLCIFRNQPINEMSQCQFPIFCCFCVSEKLHMKYSRNWMKQKAKFLFFSDMIHSPKQRRRGARGQPHHAMARATPWPRQAMVWAPGPPPDIALPPIYSPRRENPKGPNSFPENILQAATVIDARSGGSRSSSRHPSREGNHHRRPSSLSCLPPE